MHPGKIVDELLQFILVEFAVVVGIEFHRVFKHPLGIWRRRSIETIPHRTTTAGSARATFIFWTTPRSVTAAAAGTTILWTPSAGSLPEATGTAATHRAEFVFGQLAILVFVERPQHGRRHFDLLSRNYAIMIGVESFDNRLRRTTTARPSRTAGSTRTAPTTTGRLCHGGSGSRECHRRKRPEELFHRNVPQEK